ncbi:MAG: hypothetical protein HY784_08855, partial [Chloroflexi bacterium]|nr:hypothetical protein [Chloroflexota bacterium]
STEDLLWFWPRFDARPSAITVHCYGQDVYPAIGSQQFNQLTALVNEQISGYKNWDSLGISDATYQDYLSSPQMMTLELSYAPAVRVHSFYKFFSAVDTLLIPLDARHAESRAVFGRHRGQPNGGALHVQSIAPVKEYIAAAGLCSKP